MDEFSNQKPIHLDLSSVAEPVISWVETYSKGARTLGEQVGPFITNRVRSNFDVMVEVAKSAGNPMRLMEIQQHWLSDMMRDYSAQTHRCMEITGQMVQDFMTRVEHRE